MPKQVVEKKKGVTITNAIMATVFSLIPVGIIALVGIGVDNVWSYPYPRYVLYYLIVNVFFVWLVGNIAPLNKVSWLVMQGIATAATLGLAVWAYIEADPLFLHVATAAFFTYLLHLTCSVGDNIFVVAFAPPACLLVGLITVLWFVGVDMSLTAQIWIVSVLNGIFFLIAFFYVIHFFRHDGLDRVTEREVSYTEDTEEEIREKKLAKERKRAAAYAARSGSDESFEDAEEEELKRARKKRRREKAKKAAKGVAGAVGGVFGAVFGGVKAMLGIGAPTGSEDWNEYDWGDYIRKELNGTITGVPFEVSGFLPEIRVRFYGNDDSDYAKARQWLVDKFRKCTKHCPYSCSIEFSY